MTKLTSYDWLAAQSAAPYSNVYAGQKMLDLQRTVHKLIAQNLHVTSFIARQAQHGSR
jgi:hypothetical protein